MLFEFKRNFFTGWSHDWKYVPAGVNGECMFLYSYFLSNASCNMKLGLAEVEKVNKGQEVSSVRQNSTPGN